MAAPARTAASVALATMILCLVVPLATQADDLDDLDDWDEDFLAPSVFRPGGSIKLLPMAYDLSDSVVEDGGSEWSAMAALRLTVEGEPRSWFGYELHVRLEQDWYSDSLAANLGGVTETDTVLFRGLGGPATWRETDTSRLWAEVDYANLRFTAGDTDFVVGRQAVTFGRSFFWNPIDWLSTFSPTEIDREYKGGVDVARISHGLGRFSGIEMLYAYGDSGERDESALIGRAYANWGGWDVEVLGGSVWVDDRLGAAFSGDVGGAGLRGELSWQMPRVGDEKEFFRATLETDYRWPSSLYLVVELHSCGWGSDDPSDYADLFVSPRVATGQLSNVGRWYGAVQLSYEATPLLMISGAVMVNLDDGSGIFSPTLSYSLSDESRLEAGALLPWGDGPTDEGELASEYGTYYKALWLQWKLTF